MFCIDGKFKNVLFGLADYIFLKFKMRDGSILSVREDGFTLWSGKYTMSCSWEDFKVMNDAIRRITNRG
jgi:hypothetical protein